MDITIVLLTLIVLAVAYKLGVFRSIVALTNVATREADIYDREHKVKVGKRYLNKENTITAAELTKINDSIKSIDALDFD